jgi:hypothetical protein
VAFLFPYLLFLHIAGMILAFGPTYAYGFYAGLAEKEPVHRSFDARARADVTRRLTVPATLSMFVTGALMIAVADVPWLAPENRWLQLGIALYLGAIVYNVLVTRPMGAKVAAMGQQLAAQRAASGTADAAGGPPSGPPAGSPPGQPPGPPAGPPPEMAELIHKLRRDGKAMGVLTMIIVFLMVVKPTFPF